MKWEEWGPYAIRTTAFVISKYRVQDTWLYLLWHNGKLVSRGKPFDSAAAAKRHAESLVGLDGTGDGVSPVGSGGDDPVAAPAGD